MSAWVMAPLLIPLSGAILILLVRPYVRLNWRRAINLAAVVAQLAAALWLFVLVREGEILVHMLGNWPAPFGIVLVADRLAVWMLVLSALLALGALAHAVRGTDGGSRHFHSLFQLQLLGLNGAFLTGDLFNLFVFFEVLLLASYGLLLHGGGARRTGAGLHFVVLNLAGSTLFLFAAGTLYGLTGTLNLADLAVRLAQIAPETVGLVRAGALLLFGVFALKAALAPLHLWLPASYGATSAAVAALFAIMTKVGVYALLRIQTLMFGPDGGGFAGLYAPWALVLGLITIALGAIGALGARELRVQIGYLVVLSVGTLMSAMALGSVSSISAGLYYLAHSTLAAGAAFLLAEHIGRGRGALDDQLRPGPTLPAAPLLGGLFFLSAMLLAGLPPFSGFLGKWMLLQAALDHAWFGWVMALVLGAGLLAIVALARSGSVLFLGATGAVPQHAVPRNLAPLLWLLALCLGLTLAAGPLSELSTAIARDLLQPELYIRAVLGRAGGLI